MKSIRNLLTALPILALFACGSKADEPGTHTGEDTGTSETDVPVELKLTERQQAILGSQAQFNCNFFKEVNKATDEANYVISPLSMSMDFGMVANGAQRNTLAELLTALGAPNASIDELNALNKLLLSQLPKVDAATSMSLANAVWVNNNLPVFPSFTGISTSIFGADVKSLRFETPEALAAINDWAEKKTDGLVKNFLKNNPKGLVLLTNALYFKSAWTEKFDVANTSKKIFHGYKSDVKTDFMESRDARASTTSIDGVGQVLSMPFGNQSYNFSVVIPYGDLNAVISALSPEKIKELIENTRKFPYKLWVSLPKFKIETAMSDLSDVCINMGIKDAFDAAAADFSMLSPEPLYVSKVFQKAVFEIDENGGKGAAVSGIEMDILLDDNAPKCLSIDRPFFFLISERSTGAVLFMGKVSQL